MRNQVIDAVLLLLSVITEEDVAALVPAERRRLADQLRHLAEQAERGEEPKGGLKELGDGGNGE